jgi:hypothetical protein
MSPENARRIYEIQMAIGKSVTYMDFGWVERKVSTILQEISREDREIIASELLQKAKQEMPEPIRPCYQHVYDYAIRLMEWIP